MCLRASSKQGVQYKKNIDSLHGCLLGTKTLYLAVHQWIRINLQSRPVLDKFMGHWSNCTL